MSDQMMATTRRDNAEQSRIRTRYRAHCAVEVDRFSRPQTKKVPPKQTEEVPGEATDKDIDYDFYLSD